MRGALRGSSFAWEGTASMRGTVRGSVKGCCRARRRALRARRSLSASIRLSIFCFSSSLEKSALLFGEIKEITEKRCIALVCSRLSSHNQNYQKRIE